MSPLSDLMDVQELDLAADALRAQRESVPGLGAHKNNREQAATLDRALAEIEARRTALNAAESTLAAEVAAMAARAKQSEDSLYSTGVKAAKELAGMQEEVRLLKQKQADLEDRELELMEQVESTEAEMAENRERRAACDAKGDKLAAEIAAAQVLIDTELAALGAKRGAAAEGVPPAVLAHYDGLRANPRLVGRAAARLQAGSCQGCRVKLAVVEHRTIQQEPPDALVCCSNCSRVLVR